MECAAELETDTSQGLDQPAYTLTTADMTLDEFASIVFDRRKITLAPEVRRVVAASREIVDAALNRPDPVYGLNTGLGHRRNERVEVSTKQSKVRGCRPCGWPSSPQRI